VRPSRATLLLLLVLAALALLAWVTVAGRLGKSRHGYAATATAREMARAAER